MNSRKIKFTLIALVVAFVMLVSATYAWFTLSTKPEISGIQTNIGANGSLEIALLTPQTFMHPEEIKASIGSSMVNQEVTYSNLFWGNVIDLSDESYGLGQISLLPSRLDISARNGEQTVVSGGLLTVPDYGLDGRFSYFNPHVVSASYDPPYFRYSADVSFHGVRGIGTISRVTVQQAALNNARTSIQSYESATRRAMESVWRANGDTLFDILYRLHGLETQEFTSADVAVILDTCSRMLGVMDYLDAATRQGIVAVFAELIWDESQFLALKSMVENPANSLADLEDMLDAQAYLQYSYSQTLSQLIQYVPQDQQALRDIMQQCYALEGTVPDRNTIYNLLHTNLLSRDHTFINENNLFNFPSELVRDNTLTLAPTDIYYTNTGIMNHIQSYAGGYNVLFTYKDSYSISVDGNDYNQRSILSSLSSELSLLSGSGMVNEDTALLDKTYGYAIDLAVRCNTDSDLLLQTVAADRVDPNATPDPDGLLSDTQGSGSYMRFNGSVFKDQMVPLMDAIRIGFLDNRNNLIAVAKLNTSNYTEEGNEITAPLYLYDYSVAQDGSLSMGERRKGNNAILSLPEDTATVLTVVVWLDGDHVPNSLVSIMGNSIDGTLNLQFASSAELNPAFKDDPDATKPDETKPVEPGDAYYLSTDNGQYAFYTLGADGSRNYTLPFSGTVDEENHTVIIDSISAYPEQGIWIPAQATGEDGAAYSVSIDPSAPFAELDVDSVHISFVPVNGSKVSVAGTSLQHLFGSSYRTKEIYRSLDVSGLDTSNITNMSFMFFNCSSLASLDLSGFDTANVTDMKQMFFSCSGLKVLDVSGFDTSNVTDMSSMFSGCSGLTELDLSGLDTSNVTSMGFMFSECSGLTELDVSGLDTSNVTDMRWMFQSCSGLTELDVSNFDTSKVTNMSLMFYRCSGLTELDVSNFDTSKVTDMEGMFCGCSSLTGLDLSGFNTAKVTDMSQMFQGCSMLTELNITHFDTTNVVDMEYMFASCSGLTELDVSGFNTSNVTTMYEMFFNCSGLTTLDVSNFDTSKVTNMSQMFRWCSGLTELDLSSFDMSKVTDTDYMLAACSDLQTIVTPKVISNVAMDLPASYLCAANSKTYTVIDSSVPTQTTLQKTDGTDEPTPSEPEEQAEFFLGKNGDASTSFKITGGNIDGYELQLSGNLDTVAQTLTITSVNYSPTNEVVIPARVTDSATGTVYSVSVNPARALLGRVDDTATSVSFVSVDGAKVGVTSPILSSLFNDPNSESKTSYKSIDLSGLDTSTVTDMSYLFYRCSSATEINVSGLDTSNVTDMSYMFYCCYDLATVDISGFDTSKVTNMCSMFWQCKSVTELDVSGFDTSSVTNMRMMFNHCCTVTELDVSNFDTSNVTDMSYMFNHCCTVTELDLNNFDTSNVTDISEMFDTCSSLKALDLSNFDTSKVTNMYEMFRDCSSLTELDLSPLNTTNVTDMRYMFRGCSGLTTLDISPLETGNVTAMDGMFQECSGLITLDLRALNTANVTTMTAMFRDCTNLKSVDLSQFNTAKVTTMWCMFFGCSSLAELDVSSFNTSSVIDMGSMFRNCSSLTELDLSTWDMSNVTGKSYMFEDCPAVVKYD